jgi:polysaccharide biosynthesis protein PslG
MNKNKRHKVAPVGWLAFLCLALSLASLLGITACGGSSSSSSGGGTGGGGGGGGGGSTTSPPCTFTAPSPGGATTNVGTTAAIKNQFFGMHLNTPEPTVPWPFFTVNGTNEPLLFGGQRLWAAGVAWAQVNPSQGVYDWTLMQTWLSEAQQNNVDILYNLARTPAWASSQPNDSTCSTGPGECDPPIDLNLDGSGADDYWIAWITAVAQFSHTQKTSGLTGISYYEIWNEWNTGAYWSQNSSYASTAQLVRMEQDARCVVEGPPPGQPNGCTVNGSVFPSGTGIDSGAQIVSPSPVGGDVNNLLDEVQISLNNYFSQTVGGYAGGAFSDAIGFHGYVGTATGPSTTPVACPTAENVNTVITDLSQAVAAHPAVAAGKPLFDTEAGWSKAPDEGFTDPDQQAAFLARYMLLQESSNIARVYWFAWDSKSDGSLYNDTTGQIVPAATAYGEVNQWTVGATMNNACSATGTVWTCGFTRPSGYSALAVWDAGQDCTASSCPTTTFTVPGGGYIEYRDVAGNVTTLGTATSVQIGAKPILLENQQLP